MVIRAIQYSTLCNLTVGSPLIVKTIIETFKHIDCSLKNQQLNQNIREKKILWLSCIVSIGRISSLTCMTYNGILTATSDVLELKVVNVHKNTFSLARYGLEQFFFKPAFDPEPKLSSASHFSLTLTSESVTMSAMGSCLYPGL